jgi:hypothetical protein
MCPAPMCMFFAPIERVVRFVGHQLKAEGFTPATNTQVLHIAMTAWDSLYGAFLFEVYVANKDTNLQQIYIRADPASNVKHTISPDGAPLRGTGAGGSRSGDWWKQAKKSGAQAASTSVSPWVPWNHWRKPHDEEDKDKFQDPAADPWKNWSNWK